MTNPQTETDPQTQTEQTHNDEQTQSEQNSPLVLPNGSIVTVRDSHTAQDYVPPGVDPESVPPKEFGPQVVVTKPDGTTLHQDVASVDEGNKVAELLHAVAHLLS